MKNHLKVERAKRNMTQEDLAKAIQVSRQTVNAIETGKFIPSTLLALKLSTYFNTPVNNLFELEKND
jgi:putative transcriptional regulator